MLSAIGGNQRPLLLIIAIFVVMGLFLISTIHIGYKTATGIQGYLDSSERWMESKHDAIMDLARYGEYREEVYFQRHQSSLQRLNGQRQARNTLISADPDRQKAINGLKDAGVYPEVVDPMVWLFTNFGGSTFMPVLLDMSLPYEQWERSESHLNRIEELGDAVRSGILNAEMDRETWMTYRDELYNLDDSLAAQEQAFASTLRSEGYRIYNRMYWLGIILGLSLFMGGGLITYMLFLRVRNLNEKLTDSEARFRKVLDHSQDVIYQLDPQARNYEYISPAVKKMLGYEPEEFTEKGTPFTLDIVHPEDREMVRMELQRIAENRDAQSFNRDYEYRIQTKPGQYIWVNNKRTILKNSEGETIGIVGNVRDISNQKLYMDQINRALKEKETLLNEVHHRVKNNLAVISGMLHLQSENEENRELQLKLADSINRIQTMATIHEHLYECESFAYLDLAENLKGLVRKIINTMPAEADIETEFHCQTVRLSVNQAIPCSLIVNEAVSNSLKHAFSGTRQGKITIHLLQDGQLIRFCVDDNGMGLPDGFANGNGHSMGMTLIQTLTQQLRGRYRYEPLDQGTRFTLEFQKTDIYKEGEEEQPVGDAVNPVA